jgi:hypothetical protein
MLVAPFANILVRRYGTNNTMYGGCEYRSLWASSC